MGILAIETWSGTTGAAWPAQWTAAAGGGTATIQTNQGRIVTAVGAFGGTSTWLTGMTATVNTDAVFTFTCPSATTEWYLTVGTRVPAAAAAAGNAGFPNTGMALQIGYSGSVWTGSFRRVSAGTVTFLANAVPPAMTAGTAYKVRFTIIGTALSMKVWAASASEPGTATASFTDASALTAAGKLWLAVQNGAAGTAMTVNSDDLAVTDGVAPAAVSTLTDDFATADSAKWFGFDANTTVVGSQLRQAILSSYASGLSGNVFYDLTGSSAHATLVQAPNVGNGTTEAFFTLEVDANNSVSWLVGDGNQLIAERKVAGTRTNAVALTYSATTHQRLRIRESGGTVFYDTYDGTSWTQRGSWVISGFAVTAVKPKFVAGYWGTEPSPGTAIWDDFNVPPAPPPAPVPTPVPPASRRARRLDVSVYQGSYVRVGQVPDYISCSVTFAWLGVGSGELVVGEDDPIASNLLMADQVVVAVVVNLGSVRWSGRVASVTLEREGPAGSGVITATLVDEWIWLQRMLASQNGASTSLTSMPQYDTRTGPAVSVAADFINAAAARLGVPVKASKPAVDSSPSVTLKARMTPLADLLTDPMKAAGVTLSGQIWLPSDPQPPDLTTTLTTPTVVFRPQVLADKPWLQWTDSMVNIVRLAFQGQQPVAYRTIVGLSGTDAARIYDQVIDTTRQSAIGTFGLPEIYTDATDATLGAQSAAAGITSLIDAAGTVSVSLEVEDGEPFRLGDDFVVGDLATAVVSGASWRQRMTKVTVEDTRSGGLVITPTLGDRSDLSGDDMMVQALARVAESVRALQAGR